MIKIQIIIIVTLERTRDIHNRCVVYHDDVFVAVVRQLGSPAVLWEEGKEGEATEVFSGRKHGKKDYCGNNNDCFRAYES